jgi:AcrR family transcriptional regulator
MARLSNKREKLLIAADSLFLQKGTDLTTLADIAHASEVPLGNVYYYFKTKGEIISDVIKLRFKELQELLNNIDQEYQTPEEQLKAFMQAFVNVTDGEPKNLGFMLTMLWMELGKDSSNLLPEFLPLPEYVLNWCQNKFNTLGKSEQAQQYATNLLASLYGLCVNRHNPMAQELIPTQINFLTQIMGIAG